MNKFTAVAVILATSFTFSGCTSWYELKFGKEKAPISFSYLTQDGKSDGIHAWKPDASAAVSMSRYLRDSDGKIITYERDRAMFKYNQKGKITEKYYEGKETVNLYEQKTCVMSAAAIKARDSEGGLTLNVTVPEGVGTGVELGGVVRELQKITTLQSKDEAATFLDVALFGICMASMNDYISPVEVPLLMQEAIKQSASIATAIEKTKKDVMSTDASLNPMVLGGEIQDPARLVVIKIDDKKIP
ncbi:hypothetical protein [Psychrobacter sp. DAB_AL32B]|uniref:hypothetical protein n=1 Tax=Psychrobacter sp. DAB_AL32B TaxID=1028414 RepID=UPI000B7D534E|nr:hypothetical protein [Psychrobacter sp. DAB_AL32B]OXL18920.1 hypothetical protein CAN34_11680 [Psychrobacter sp. DAB_AL32B]QBQ68695.1 hypothetical protein pP32BP2_p24 [Psychrobacter sp. DAB_AL32B]